MDLSFSSLALVVCQLDVVAVDVQRGEAVEVIGGGGGRGGQQQEREGEEVARHPSCQYRTRGLKRVNVPVS